MAHVLLTLLIEMPYRQNVRSLLERVSDRPWVTAAELLLIGSVVFAVLRFLQGTRGARLVRAVLTILVVSFAVVWLIADQLDSERIKLLYPYFLVSVFLVSLVAFQAELRRLLFRVGEGGWLQRWVRGPEPALDAIVTAVECLSAKRIGALIAIERAIELGAFVDTGVRLDAVASPELLETIFWPGTPLHDLGVVIQQGRIIAAGCLFPLTESETSDRSLGSRHRAGIGLSEEVDAVVIIVSEETGRISVAMGGKLLRSLDLPQLRGLLEGDAAGPLRTATVPPLPTGKKSAASGNRP